VHRPRSDTWLLADVMRSQRIAGAKVADLCTGSGALAIVAARAGAERVVAVDISLRSTVAARGNARLNGCSVEVRRGDLFESLDGERFDMIVCNPPYVPAETDALPRHRATTALDGGRDGRLILDRVCREAPAHMGPDSSLLLVQSSVCGVQETCERLEAQSLQVQIVTRARGPLGPVLRARAPMLRERGLIGEGETEELVVIRARRP
jgi:release factor glutamine methyltransferase